MGILTGIQWCHHTFNAWWGCDKVSAACRDCYAEALARRWGWDIWGPNKPRRFFGDKHWAEPLKWNTAAAAAGERRRVFCSSMADVFEERSDLEEMDSARFRLWKLIEATPWLDWMLLTKRPENHEMVPLAWCTGSRRPTNVWLGATVEDSTAQVMRRVDHLLAATWPAVRFLSMEPLLDDVDIEDDALAGATVLAPATRSGFGSPVVPKIDLVIVGGESGRRPRDFYFDRARVLRDRCRRHGTAFFFKQAGARPIEGGQLVKLKNRHHGGDLDEIPADLRIRMMPGDSWAA